MLFGRRKLWLGYVRCPHGKSWEHAGRVLSMLGIMQLASCSLLFEATSTQVVDGGDTVVESVYSRTVTIHPPQLDETLSGFPTFVSLETDTGLAAHALDNGRDIFFTNSAGAVLPFQIESFDGTTGSIAAWVRMETLLPGDTEIMMRYGSADAANLQAPRATWADTYAGVWHFAEGSNTSGVFLDSSGNANDTAVNDQLTSPEVNTGIAGPGLVFNGTSDSLVIPNSENRNLNFPMSSFSLSLWVNVSENAGDWDTPFKKGGSHYTTPGYSIELGDPTWGATLASDVDAETAYLDFGEFSALKDRWVHLGIVIDRGALLARSFVDGFQVDDVDLTNLGSMDGSDIAMVGRDGENNFFNGQLDELRVHSVARSAAWMKAEFDNIQSPELFVTIGPEVEDAL